MNYFERPITDPQLTRTCDICGQPFEAEDERENVCSTECEAKWNGRNLDTETEEGR